MREEYRLVGRKLPRRAVGSNALQMTGGGGRRYTERRRTGCAEPLCRDDQRLQETRRPR